MTPYIRSGRQADQVHSMPHDCERRDDISTAQLIKNRSNFMWKHIFELGNESKVVTRAIWRADGLALDWTLNRQRGIHREFWPADDCDRSKFAKEVVERCRAMRIGRRILSTKTYANVVRVAWVAESQEDGPLPAPSSVPKASSQDATSVRRMVK